MKTEIVLAINFHASWLQVVIVAVVSILFIRIIQFLNRKKNTKEQTILDNWHNDPSNWKLGMFYYNPLDKRIFPPKRISGMGWTINFANPLSILALLGLLLFIAVVVSLEKE